MWTTGVVLVVFLGTLSLWSRGLGAPLMVVAVLAVGAFYWRVLKPAAALAVLLLVANLAGHFTFSVGPVAIRAEQVAALAATAYLALTCIRAGDFSTFKPRADEWPLLAWIAVSVLSSLLDSPDRGLSAKVLALTTVCTLGFFLPRRVLSGSSGSQLLEVVVRWLLIAFATESAYGVLAYLLHVFGPTISIGPNPASGHLEAYGTLWEQNVFGAFAAGGAVAWVYLGPGRFKKAWIGLAMCLGGLIGSLTRAAWLASAVVGALGVLVPGLRRRLNPSHIGAGLLGGLMVAAAVVIVEKFGTYTVAGAATNRGGGLLLAIFNLTDFIGRLNQTRPVWSDISGHLILGRGTASFEALHLVNGVPQHVASLPLLVLNDTGLLGLVLFSVFGIAVAARAWSGRKNPIVLGLGQMAIVVALANLATETTELMIGWLLIGILLAACDVASRAAPPGRPAPAEVRST